MIDEKVSVLTFANAYRVYDLSANVIASVEQANISVGAKAARLIVGKRTKGLQSFYVNIRDENNTIISHVKREGAFRISGIIYDDNDTIIATLERHKKVYNLVDSHNQLLCSYTYKSFFT